MELLILIKTKSFEQSLPTIMQNNRSLNCLTSQHCTRLIAKSTFIFITYSQEKYHYNELSFIQLHQIALQKKNNINKKQINEKHF